MFQSTFYHRTCIDIFISSVDAYFVHEHGQKDKGIKQETNNVVESSHETNEVHDIKHEIKQEPVETSEHFNTLEQNIDIALETGGLGLSGKYIR